MVDLKGVVLAFEVQPLNVNERVPAGRLLARLPDGVRRVLADGNYDSAKLHALLEGTGRKFYAPPLGGRASRQTHRRRRILVRLLSRPMGQRLADVREDVERQFARMGNHACGLKELPSWVRRQRRVQRWISSKILLHHAYLLHKQQTA